MRVIEISKAEFRQIGAGYIVRDEKQDQQS